MFGLLRVVIVVAVFNLVKQLFIFEKVAIQREGETEIKSFYSLSK